MRASQNVHGSQGMAVRDWDLDRAWGSSFFVCAVVFCFLFFLRLPTILSAHELNVDESQMLSQGMKFLLDPMPWRAVDGTTSGPLNSYLISLFLLMGFRANYALAHGLATGLLALQVVLAHQTLLRITSRRAAAWGILPMMFALGFTRNRNYLHYASELLPALLLALGFYSFVVWMQQEDEGTKPRRWLMAFVAGLTLGCAPWCKLQALPMSAALSGLVFLAMLFRGNSSRGVAGRRIASAAAFGAGAVLPSCVILSVVARGGAIRDFWYSYILSNFRYAGGLEVSRLFKHLGIAIARPETLPLFLACFAAGIVLFLQVADKRDMGLSSKEHWIVGILACWLAAALFAVCRPARFFTHYTIFLFYPTTCLAAILFHRGFATFKKDSLIVLNRWCRLSVEAVTLFLLLFTAYQIVQDARDPREPDGNDKIAATVVEIRREHGVKSMAIWGWAPGVYVLTGIPPATRDAIPYNAINKEYEKSADGHSMIRETKIHPYFGHRFVSDLRDAKPDLFIDAVAPGAFMWTWTPEDGYESDGETREFINQNYYEIKDLPLASGGKPVRFFLRREYLSR